MKTIWVVYSEHTCKEAWIVSAYESKDEAISRQQWLMQLDPDGKHSYAQVELVIAGDGWPSN